VDLGQFDPLSLNLVFGYYLAPMQFIERSIVYQLEPVAETTIDGGHVPVDLLREHVVWDYNRRNIEQLGRCGIQASYVPPAYHPSLERVAPIENEDIDVLFYGWLSQRRTAILTALRYAGLKVRAVDDCYGKDLDPLIARAKVVLCMHSQPWMRVVESVRITYLFANRKAVVAEVNPEDDSDGLECGMLAVPYDRLVSTCAGLVGARGLRAELASAGYSLITERSVTSVLPKALRDPVYL
jgi:hypothetical protein